MLFIYLFPSFPPESSNVERLSKVEGGHGGGGAAGDGGVRVQLEGALEPRPHRPHAVPGVQRDRPASRHCRLNRIHVGSDII